MPGNSWAPLGHPWDAWNIPCVLLDQPWDVWGTPWVTPRMPRNHLGIPGSLPGCLEPPPVTPGSVLGCPEPPCGLLNDLWDTWDPLGHPQDSMYTPGSSPECLEPPLGHPQDTWDPLGTPKSLSGCLGPSLHHSRDPFWITPRVSGSPLRCLSLLEGTLAGAPCAFTAQGTATQQPRCRLPRGHRQCGALFPL